MTPLDILSTIRQAGGRVLVLDGDLQVVAPAGTLTPEAVGVLREHKPDLIRLLPDAEREAIQWVEGLPPTEAAVVVEQAVREWTAIVGTPEPVLDQDDGSDPWEAAAEPIPCRQCGGITAWWDLVGKRHCLACDLPRVTERDTYGGHGTTGACQCPRGG